VCCADFIKQNERIVVRLNVNRDVARNKGVPPQKSLEKL
jgi:hypothetical protein